MRTFNFFDKNNNLIKKKLFSDKKVNHKILKEMGFFVVRSVFDNKTLEKYTINKNSKCYWSSYN